MAAPPGDYLGPRHEAVISDILLIMAAVRITVDATVPSPRLSSCIARRLLIEMEKESRGATKAARRLSRAAFGMNCRRFRFHSSPGRRMPKRGFGRCDGRFWLKEKPRLGGAQ
jgi:hypothetical protein